MKAKQWIQVLQPLCRPETDEQVVQFNAEIDKLHDECKALIFERLERMSKGKGTQTPQQFAEGYKSAILESSSKWNAVAHGFANNGVYMYPLLRGFMALEMVMFFQEMIEKKNALLEEFGTQDLVLVDSVYRAILSLPAAVGFNEEAWGKAVIEGMNRKYSVYLLQVLQDLAHRRTTRTAEDYMKRAGYVRRCLEAVPLSMQATVNMELGRIAQGNAFQNTHYR